MRFLLGGYSADGGGSATGIGLLAAGAADDHLAGGPLGYAGDVVRADSPSWITVHPTRDVVYAALEHVGAVQAFRRTGETSFEALGEPVRAGGLTCHVMVTADASTLVASCWEDGSLVRMSVDAAGRLSAPVTLPAAAAPDEPDLDTELFAAASDRISRAHQMVQLSRDVFASTDMGLDRVRIWSGRGFESAGHVELPRGTGPRHMVWHPSGHLYVVTELSREVFVLTWDRVRARWHVVGGAQLGSPLPDDLSAEIALSRDAEHVYVGLRGSNTIATLRVRGNGALLEPIALVDAGVDWPRHHVIERDTLLIAGQRSDEVVSLAIDERTGVPGRVRHRTAAPSPTCLRALV